MTGRDRPRLEEFASWLRTVMPTLKGDYDARPELEGMSAPDLLIAYLNWNDRFIFPRPRKILRHKDFWDDGSESHREIIVEIARQLEVGLDTSDRVSPSARTHGYLSSAFLNRYPKERWKTRDIYLNGHDTHHLHLGGAKTKNSRDLLFVAVSRAEAMFIGVGDHRSFDDGRVAHRIAELKSEKFEIRGIIPPSDGMTATERAKLERLGFGTLYEVDGKMIAGALQTSSNHSVAVVRFADQLTEVIEHYDQQLDDHSSIIRWFEEAGRQCPPEPALKWRMQGCDLILLEERSRIGFSPVQGRWRR